VRPDHSLYARAGIRTFSRWPFRVVEFWIPDEVAAALAWRAGPASDYTKPDGQGAPHFVAYSGDGHIDRRRVYYCVICAENPVNVRAGFDTCDYCARHGAQG